MYILYDYIAYRPLQDVLRTTRYRTHPVAQTHARETLGRPARRDVQTLAVNQLKERSEVNIQHESR